MLFQKLIFQSSWRRRFKPLKIRVCSDTRNPFVSPPRGKLKIQTVDVKRTAYSPYSFINLMSKAIYKENCFSIYCNPYRCSNSCKFYPQFCFLPLASGNKHILFALALFDIAHKNTKICFLTDSLLLLRIRFRYPQD